MLKSNQTYNHPGFRDVYMHIVDLVEETDSHLSFKVLWVNRYGNLAYDKHDTVHIDKSDLANWEAVDV